MIFEQSLINPNFIGRDGFKWFVGIISNQQPDNNTDGHSYRVKVRILGYHPGNEIADEDLPWAHVLVPLNMGSGAGGSYAGNTTRGSELVFGFFADGDDAQQPIIVGAFYRGSSTEYLNNFEFGTQDFKLFKQKTGAIQSPNNIPVKDGQTYASVSGPISVTGEIGVGTDRAQCLATYQLDNSGERTSIPGTCEGTKDDLSKINQALVEFIKILNTVKQVKTGFVDPVLNRMVNIDQEVQKIALVISDTIKKQIKIWRNELVSSVYVQIESWFNQIKLPAPVDFAKKILGVQIIDGIKCLFRNILKKVKDFVFKFLMNLIGQIISAPFCAVEALTGSLLTTAANEVASAIGPSLDELSNEFGVISDIGSIIDTAISYTETLISFLICDESPCKDVYDYKNGEGYINKNFISDVSKFINYSPAEGLENLFDDANIGEESDKYLKGLEFASCPAFTFTCGAPKVEIFGGGGSGGAGNAVIDSVGSIIGVNLTDPGSGYSSPPYLKFVDDCKNGKGARGFAVLDEEGKVSDVVITDSGSGYLTGTQDTQDSSTLDAVDSSGSSVVGSVVDVYIINTGLGYTENDTINDDADDNGVVIYPEVDDDGRIIGVKINNPGSVRLSPNLQINSETGSGAILIPILKFNPIEKVEKEQDPSKVKQVILCAEDHDR
jgi:hypothetical protein